MERPSADAGRRNSRPGGTFAGAPVLLALAFMVVVSLDLSGPGVRAAARDSGHARMAVRPLAEALARAVRGMVGVQTQRPVARSRATGLGAFDRRTAWAEGADGRAAATGHHVRESLLSLPPPPALA